MPNKWQAITWTNDDQDLTHDMEKLVVSELNSKYVLCLFAVSQPFNDYNCLHTATDQVSVPFIGWT